MNFKKCISVAVFAGAVVSPAFGCDFCSVYYAQEAQGRGTGIFAGVAEQFTHFGSLRLDGQKVSNDAGQFLNSSIAQLFVGYNFNKRFGLQLNLPFIHRSYLRPRGADIERGNVSGMGDVSLVGNIALYERTEGDFTFNWTILGGVKFPTGSAERLNDEEVESEAPLPDSAIAGHDLAMGSGSVDGIIGTTVTSRVRRLFVAANVQYAIRSRGDFGHQYANDLTWSGGPGVYLLLGSEYTVSLQVVVSGETKGRDNFHGRTDDDSAATTVSVGPQLNLTWSNHLGLQLGADLPVSIRESGLQTVPDYRLRGALTWRF